MKSYEEKINRINRQIEKLKEKLLAKKYTLNWFEITEMTEEEKEKHELLKQLNALDVGDGYKCVGYLDGGYPNMQERYTEDELLDLEMQLNIIEKQIDNME